MRPSLIQCGALGVSRAVVGLIAALRCGRTVTLIAAQIGFRRDVKFPVFFFFFKEAVLLSDVTRTTFFLPNQNRGSYVKEYNPTSIVYRFPPEPSFSVSQVRISRRTCRLRESDVKLLPICLLNRYEMCDPNALCSFTRGT